MKETLAAKTIETTAPRGGATNGARNTHVPLNWRVIIAIGAVWLLWGSTFAGMRLAVETIPPFAMASLRFTLAGAILYGWCAARRRASVTRSDLIRAAVTGSTLLVLGNGVTAWTVQFLPTGLNSLLLSLVPIWMAVIAFIWGGERPSPSAILGMLLGLSGLALLLLQHGTKAGFPVWPTTLALFASVAWAYGSVYQRRAPSVPNFVLATALQMLFGGVVIGIQAAIFGDWRMLDVHAISAASISGFTWLVVFGSLVGYSAYLYTMRHASTSIASTYAYVNPVVAVGIGILLFHERFTPVEAISGAIILGGVALMLRPSASRTSVRDATDAGWRPFKISGR